MTDPKMHADEVDLSPAVVARLVGSQFPEWADLPVTRVESAGTDHALYRLGESLVVRLPRLARTAAQVVKEQRWLPFLAPHLPLPVPVPVAAGASNEEYPFDWSVCRWLDGHDAIASRLVDPRLAATQLASFINALQGVDPADGPRPGRHNFGRGVALAWRDARARECLVELADVIDVDRATKVWDEALSTPEWSQPGRWVHGDLLPGNLLVDNGHLAGVIDFGGLAVGDPAVDMMAAWTVFEPEARGAFHVALDVDNDTWARGRGWSVSWGMDALAYYGTTNPVLAGIAKFTIGQALLDR